MHTNALEIHNVKIEKGENLFGKKYLSELSKWYRCLNYFY